MIAQAPGLSTSVDRLEGMKRNTRRLNSLRRSIASIALFSLSLVSASAAHPMHFRRQVS
jgi:hypothetical protein